jgi:hypothetical protein
MRQDETKDKQRAMKSQCRAGACLRLGASTGKQHVLDFRLARLRSHMIQSCSELKDACEKKNEFAK